MKFKMIRQIQFVTFSTLLAVCATPANAALVTVTGLNTQKVDITVGAFPAFSWEFINDTSGGNYIFSTGTGYTAIQASFDLGGPPPMMFATNSGLNLNALQLNSYSFYSTTSGFAPGVPGSGQYFVSGGFLTNANSGSTAAQLAADSHLVLHVEIGETFSDNRFLGYVYDDGQQPVDFANAVSLLTVPEPSNLAFLSLAGLAMAMKRRRR